jgi:methyltransferase (TIGR00027 family)
MTEPAIQHVSDTAFLIAHFRAVESARPDALFHDPLAARLAGEKGKALAESFRTRAMTGWMTAIRTVIIDELVQGAIARGVDTVLCLGAGLDTRPYRLELPSEVSWIEVDFPDVIAFKEERLRGESPLCRLERIGVDLSDEAARREMLARIDARSGHVLVLTEGLAPYLTNEQVGSLADDLRALSSVRGWIIDYVSKEGQAYRERAGVSRQMGNAQFRFHPEDWFGFFAHHGWFSREVKYLPLEGRRLGRRAPLPRRYRVLGALTRPFTSATARRKFGRFSGYVLLEPVLAPRAPEPEQDPRWKAVDDYVTERLVSPDAALDAALESSAEAGLPPIAVSPPQGKLLDVLARSIGARRVLEIGTLGGYSTIWLARAVGPEGRVITLEIDPAHAAVAAENLDRAGCSERVDIRVGSALESLDAMIAAGEGPFDLFFIDADKVSTPQYFQRALQLARPGSLIVVDNVVRKGALPDPATEDASVQGVRRLHDLVAATTGVSATTIQTVGAKGYDGFLIATVIG